MNYQKKHFELLVVTATIAILAGMLLPALNQARSKARYANFHGCVLPALGLPKGTKVMELKEFKTFERSTKYRAEILGIANGELDIRKSKMPRMQQIVKEFNNNPILADLGDLYEQWASFTGNPKKLTRQQFDILKEKNLIVELKFDKWKLVTGNPQSLTEEEFNALKANDAISFPVKQKLENKGSW